MKSTIDTAAYSYKKGHKYITVIVNHDTNTVVWASEGHGKSVLEKFYKQLTPEQLSSIKVVTGDGAKWICPWNFGNIYPMFRADDTMRLVFNFDQNTTPVQPPLSGWSAGMFVISRT